MPVIKRYANRKLYDTDAKRYITLDGIAEQIRRGREVHVTDHETGEDITAQIQAQIIFEEEKKIGGVLPRPVFTNLIQAGNQKLSQLWQAILPPGAVEAELERRMLVLVQQGDVAEDEGLRLLEKLKAVSASPAHEPAALRDGDIQRVLQQRDLPTRTELQRIVQQVEALRAELDQLNPPGKPKAKTKTKAK
jgi:polyhydroxyalkanoate synthesis repressor PhaR